MSFIQRIFELLLSAAGRIVLAAKRLVHRPALTLMALAGIVLAVGLVSSAGFFAQAVDRVVLLQELADFTRQTGRPPFSMRVYTLPSSDAPLGLEDVERLASHVGGTLASEIGLPLKFVRVSVESGGMMVWATKDAGTGGSSLLGIISLAYYQDIENHLDFTGEPLQPGKSGETLDTWIHVEAAEKMGFNAGDTLDLVPFPGAAALPVRIVGLWQTRDPRDPFWFSNPDLALGNTLLVRRDDYLAWIQPHVPAKTGFASWHLILDETRLLPSRAADYLAGFTRAMLVVQKYLPDAKLDVAPLRPLEQFVNRSRTLTILLLGFNVPAFGFLLYFLVLTSAIIARWQRREVAILVSRGMSLSSILGVTLAEEGLLFLPGLPLGIGLGVLVSQLMGQTASFLVFTPRPPLPISLDGANLSLIAAALGVALIARLWPAFTAARQSAVEEEREESRLPAAPSWQRYYLDFGLALITAYAYYQLNERGTLAMLVRDRPADLYRDPLMILVPALFVLTAGLLVMRLFPLIVAAMDVIANWTPWTVPHLALRQLGRQSQAYVNPLLLIIVCLALGVYTFSLSASMDQWLVDRMYYKTGADLSFVPQPLGADSSGSGSQSSEASEDPWVLPLEDFLGLPGVAGGTEVGNYAARASFTGRGSVSGRFLALDRLTFPNVAWFRDDFATESLGGLMNLLAQQPDAILVPQQVLDMTHIRIGEQFRVTVSMGDGMSVQIPFTIVGTYKYFPTVYEDTLAAIGNLDYLFSFSGMPMPHAIWLRLQPAAQGADVVKAMRDMGVEPAQIGDTGALIAEEKAKTERVGIFGTLSVGFLAAALMALAGLLINTYASFNRRQYEFTVLRALGLYRGQALGQVLLEYLFLTAYGAAAGAAVGMAAAILFSPFFRVTGMREAPLPPLLPIIAQDRIMGIAVAMAAIMIVLEMIVIAAAISGRMFRSLALRSQA